jgi:hypothetical protein
MLHVRLDYVEMQSVYSGNCIYKYMKIYFRLNSLNDRSEFAKMLTSIRITQSTELCT